ncbi:MAG: 1-(5-phosphoribosyl)-5-[(5-phosphoribosylamino) methylideneamino]imidazole-4-carboxamide isomerase [Acidimicrobiales bacterium]
MMDLYPAIDLRGGRCVRLRQGDYDDETVYGDDPVAVATSFAEAGVRWIHVVDLDAARTGEPTNRDVVSAIAVAVAPVGVCVQSGGGVRSAAAAEALWDGGVTRVVLGTAAVEDPGLVIDLARLRPGGVAVGIDTRDGEVAVRGWVRGSGVTTADVLARLGDAGAAAVIVTDIGRDGMLVGPDLAGLRAVIAETHLDVIASGGVGSAADVEALASLRTAGRGLAGAIVGKAIYEGRLSVQEGVAACAASV